MHHCEPPERTRARVSAVALVLFGLVATMVDMKPRKPQSTAVRVARPFALIVALVCMAMALGACRGFSEGLARTFGRVTPTPSATPGVRPTATPDFRATRSVEDYATQQAYASEVALLPPDAATREAERWFGKPPTPTPPSGIAEQPGMNSPLEAPDLTAAAVVVAPPSALGPDDATATALAAGGAIVDTPAPPLADQTQPGQTPVDQPPGQQVPDQPPDQQLPGQPPGPNGETPPLETPTPAAIALTEAPTASPTLLPTIAPTLPPAATSTPMPVATYVVGTLAGVVDRQNGPSTISSITTRLGPSSVYTAATSLPIGTSITLQARDTSGEWIYFCCQPGSSSPAWVRAAYVRPLNNPTPGPPYSGLNPDDTRWLQIRASEPGLSALPVNTPAPAQDFPMARVDRSNTGRVTQLPQLPLQIGWDPNGSAGLAGGPFTSGIMVTGANVVSVSSDGHAYSFDRESGAQRWRYYVGETVTGTPLALNGVIYILTQAGELIPLTNEGTDYVDDVWAYGVTPHGSPISDFGRILFTGRTESEDRLYGVETTMGVVVQNIIVQGATELGPTAGGQLIFLASDRVRAYDFFNNEMVWQSPWGGSFTAPPLYASPGMEASSELYLVDTAGILTALDANTGAVLWQTQIGGVATGLAANPTVVVATGDGFVRAFARSKRTEGQLLWQAGINGRVLGGALIDDTRIFVATDAGAFQYFDISTGALIQGNVTSPQASAPVAVSGPWIYAPTTNSVIYGVRQATQ